MMESACGDDDAAAAAAAGRRCPAMIPDLSLTNAQTHAADRSNPRASEPAP